MNPPEEAQGSGFYAKPRSRGDEPGVVVQHSADYGKTPLTRG